MEKYNLRCDKCGRFIKRGILNHVRHADECKAIKTYSTSFKESHGFFMIVGSEVAEKFNDYFKKMENEQNNRFRSNP